MIKKSVTTLNNTPIIKPNNTKLYQSTILSRKPYFCFSNAQTLNFPHHAWILRNIRMFVKKHRPMSKKTKKTMSNQAYPHLPLTSNQKNEQKYRYIRHWYTILYPHILKYSSPTYLNKYKKKTKKFVSLQNLWMQILSSN